MGTPGRGRLGLVGAWVLVPWILCVGGTIARASGSPRAPLAPRVVTPDAALSWEEEVRLGTELQFRDVAFLDGQRGWVVGARGRIFRTTDGGRTWVRQAVRAPDLFRIAFVTEREGWVIGEAGFVLHTTTAGASWVRRPRLARVELLGIRFVTPEVGWIVGDRGLIFKTQDGGRTWRRQRSGVRGALSDIACFSAQECVVVGWAGTVLTTVDGGAAWRKRTPPEGSYRHSGMSRVVIDGTGALWSAVSWHNGGFLLRSTDRGERWTVVRESGPVNALHFWNGKGAIFAGAIFVTTDGGATWSEGQTPWPAMPLLLSVVFIDDHRGWAVGDFRTILHTADGGRTWVVQHEEFPPPVR